MHVFSIHYCCLLHSPSSHLRPQLLQRETYCCSPATTLQDFLGVGGAHVVQDGEPTATSAIFGGSIMQSEYERAEKTFHLCTLSQLGYPQFLTTDVLQLLQFFVDFQQSSPLGEVVEFLLSFLCLNTLLDVPRVLLTNDYLLNRTYFLHKVLHKIVDGGMVWQMNASCLLNDSQVFSQVLLKMFLGFFLGITLYFAEEVPVCSHMLRYGSTATSICCCQFVIDHAFCLLEAVDQSSFPSGIVSFHLVNGANWVQEIICSDSFRKQCLFGRHIAQLFYRMHPSITPEVSFFITKQSFLLLAVRIEAEVERQLAIHDWDWQSLSYYQLLAYKNIVAVVSINHSTMYRLRLSSSGTSCLLRRRLASSGYVLAQSRLSRLSLRRGGVALGGVGGSRLVLFLLLSSQAAFCFSEIMFQDSFMLCAFSLDRANALFFFSSIYLLCFSSSPQLSEPSAPPTCSPICRSCVWQRYSMRSAAVEFWMHCCWICGMLAFVVQKRQIRMHFWI